MTKRLEHAFQKATRELSEAEQDVLATFLLQSDLHQVLDEGIHWIHDYHPDTQQAIQEAAERKNVNSYHSSDELFQKLGA